MKRFFKNKKGQEQQGAKSIYYLVYGMGLTALLFILLYAVNYYSNSYLYIDKAAEHEIYSERAINCFSLKDDAINREYPILDLSQMNEANLNRCFSGSYKGIRLVLTDLETNKEIILRNDAQPIPKEGVPYYVLYKQNDEIRKATLLVGLS